MKQPLKILHVEDDANDADLVRFRLSAGGIDSETRRVETREEFLEALEEDEYDMILSDCTMPAFNGLTALKIAHERVPSVPFIFVSGTIGEEVAAETLKNGATDFVLKDRMNRLLPAVKRALQTAKETRKLPPLDKLFEQQSLHAIIVRNYENKIIYWSPAAEALYGYRSRDAIGQDYGKLLQFNWPDAWEKTRSCMLENGHWKGQILQRKRDGTAITVESSWILDKETFVILTIENDVTVQAASSEALRNREENQRNLLDEDVAAIFLATLDGKIISCNRSFIKCFGFRSRVDALSMNLFSMIPGMWTKEELTSKLYAERETTSKTYLIKKIDGTPAIEIENLIGVFDAKGNLKYIKGYLLDPADFDLSNPATDDREKRDALCKALHGVAGDFNNLLSVILGYSSALTLHKADPEKVADIASIITKAGQRGNALIRQLLAFSHHENKSSISVNLSSVLDELIQALEHAMPERIKLYYETPVEPVSVIANPSHLRYLLLDLCLHAKILLPDKGSTTIRTQILQGASLLRKFPDAVNVPYVNLSISHMPTSGCNPSAASFLEDMFYNPERRIQDGIDFAAAFGALNYNRGLMEITSEQGTGISFQLYLPTQMPQMALDSAHAHAEMDTVHGNQETLLVVDDEEMLLQVLKSFLTLSGYRVLIARDGVEATAIYRKHQKQIRLVLMDSSLPRTNGFMALRRIKEFDPDAKVILAGSFISSEQMSESQKAGAVDIITKPYVPDNLLQVIHHALAPAQTS